MTQPKRLEVGMTIKTRRKGLYTVTGITRDCTCPSFDYAPQPPHMHIICKDVNGKERHIGHIDEATLTTLYKVALGPYGEDAKPDYDQVTILGCDQPVQMTIF